MQGRLSVACFVMFQQKLNKIKYAAKNKDTKAEEYTQKYTNAQSCRAPDTIGFMF